MKNNIQRNLISGNRRRASGMILLLVIAILVLLALMGSVYVLMAGADRQSTNASNGNASLALAQASVLNIVRGQIGAQLTDGNGYYLNGATPKVPYARTWDMPQLGNTASIAPTAPSAFYTDTQDRYRSEPWLVSLPDWLPESYLPPDTNLFWSGVDPTKIQTGPAAMEIGAYTSQSVPTSPGVNTTPPLGFTPTSNPGPTYPLFSMLSPFLYDPATGLNDIGMSYQLTGGTPVTTPGTQGTVYVPNASVVFPAWSNSVWPTFSRYGIDDSCWNLLPYSSPNGTRYRFAVRIMDTNSMLNLNVGQATGAAYNPGGQYFNGYGLGYAYDTSTSPAYCTVNNNTSGTSDMINVLQVGIARHGTLANYTMPSVWQQALWTRDVGGTDSAAISLFGASSELALRAFQGSIPATGMASGAAEPFYDCRPGLVLPTTFGFDANANLGQPWKMFFTSYSKDRPLRTEPDTTSPFGLTSSATFSVNGVNWQEWPASPGKIFINAPADAPALVAGSATNSNPVGADVAGGVALTAAQIAQAMVESGFVASQGQALAANYMTYRMGVANGGASGPSFIDASGPCIRGANGTINNFNIGTFAAPTNEMIAGVAAQPFIVQAAVYVTPSKTAVNYQNYAVVLYNPFGAPLALTNWLLELYNGSTYSATTLLNVTIPANGYLVVVQQNLYFTVSPSPTVTLQQGAMIFAQSSAAQNVVLLRPFVNRAGVASEMPVDSFNIQPLMSGNVASFPGGPGVYTLQRNCVPGATTTAGDWYCDNANQTVAPGLWAAKLGTATGTPILPAFGIPLYDRFADPADCPGYYGSPNYLTAGVTAAAGSPLLNIADFETSPFLANFAKVSSTSYLPLSPISLQVAALPKNTNEPNTNLQYEANARLDFFDDPATALPQPAAVTLLDYITFDSVFSDGSVNDGSLAQNKLAVPGRININTASMPVLEAMIGSFDASTLPTASPQALATDINQYSLRLGAPFNAIRGLGFHSKAELTYALENVLNGTAPISIVARDNATGFADLYNMATVRSDTFICYTYIQALRLNEAYIQNGGVYNVTDWYNATQGITPLGSEGSISNAQSVQSGTTTLYPEFILEGQKRFAALIDRTNATTNGAGANSANPADPQVVALQGLPQ